MGPYINPTRHQGASHLLTSMTKAKRLVEQGRGDWCSANLPDLPALVRTRPDDRQSIGASGVVAAPVPASSLDGKTAMIFRLPAKIFLLLLPDAVYTQSVTARFAKAQLNSKTS